MVTPCGVALAAPWRALSGHWAELLGCFGCRYCVEFQLAAITPGCLHSQRSHTRWMQYLREGHTVCVECQHPALDSTSLHCYGDGGGSKK